MTPVESQQLAKKPLNPISAAGVPPKNYNINLLSKKLRQGDRKAELRRRGR